MELLFICTYNVGRSQMAAALYNSLSRDGHADSAGTTVDEEGQTLGDRAKKSVNGSDAVKVMKEDGLDISHQKRRAVTREMLDRYDQIIVMADPHTIPRYLHDHPKAVYWHVPDPRFKGIDAMRETRDDLKRKIVDLLG